MCPAWRAEETHLHAGGAPIHFHSGRNVSSYATVLYSFSFPAYGLSSASYPGRLHMDEYDQYPYHGGVYPGDYGYGAAGGVPGAAGAYGARRYQDPLW